MSFQHNGDLFASEGQREQDKQQRQEIEDEGEGEGDNREGGGVFALDWDKGLPLDREARDGTHRQVAVYKGKRGNPVLG